LHLDSKEEHQIDDQVSWLLEMTVKPGELDNLKALIKEMVESTRAEPGALNYQWCISDDKHHRSQL
jgi:quinol monooxygenase YgiN